MKKNIVFKIILALLIALMLFISFQNVVNAWTPNWNQFDGVDGGKADEAATSIVGSLINLISTIGAGFAIIMLVILGIQYVSANALGKTQVKEGLTKYVIGAVLIFAASGILKLVQMFIDSNVNNI